jgi:hypothetical protein
MSLATLSPIHQLQLLLIPITLLILSILIREARVQARARVQVVLANLIVLVLSKKANYLSPLLLLSLDRDRTVTIFYLIVEDVITNVVPLRRLWSQNEGLHESTEGFPVVGQLPPNLDHNSIPKSFLRIYLIIHRIINLD